MAQYLGDNWQIYGVLFAAGFLVTEPWRWLGVRLSRDLDIESETFKWVRAVSTALVAGLVTRMLLFPSGALDEVPVWIRIVALGAGTAVYLAGGRVLAFGVIAGVVTLLGGTYLVGI